MKKGRFNAEQIIGILKQHEAGQKVADLAREHGISEATIYTWKSKYGGMEVSEAPRLKALDDENRRLKALVADLSLDREMLKAVIRAMMKSARARPHNGSAVAAGFFVRLQARGETVLTSFLRCSSGQKKTVVIVLWESGNAKRFPSRLCRRLFHSNQAATAAQVPGLRENRVCLLRTDHAIRASLFATATDTTLGCDRDASPVIQSPNGSVSRLTRFTTDLAP
jgi:putative transposase